MLDRAMQALYLLALEPVSETTADRNRYGFRPIRSTADAIEQCFVNLSRKSSAEWVLEGDIKGCFDNISHDWLLANVPLDKQVLRRWLKAGYLESGSLFATGAGTPQGGIISPVLANMALDGLEAVLEAQFGQKNTKASYKTKVNYVRYADDFVITGISKELLENEVKPLVEAFMAERGLTLSAEKTLITHVDDGFDFLGQNIRKYNGKLLRKPSRKNLRNLLQEVKGIISGNKTVTAGLLVSLLNPVLRGWANYHRHIVAKETFNYVDYRVWKMLWQWCRRRHANRSKRWIKAKYFKSVGVRNWVFSGEIAEQRMMRLIDGVVEINQGLSAELRFQVLEDGTAEEPETVIITLDPALNRGSQAQTTIRISEQNIAPAAALQVLQAGEKRLTLSQAGGVATIEATVSDANPADQLSGSWLVANLLGASQAGNTLSFDPAQQTPGVYPISYTVQDNGSPQLQATTQVFVVIQPSLPVLTDADSDGDLIPDHSEGFADTDGDGIPDYLDAINECNVVPAEGQQQVSYLAEGEPGVCLRRGSVAVLSDSGGLQVKAVELQPDSTANNIGGIFDFIAYGLPVQGQSYNLVLPQRNPVPANAVYRKFTEAGGWVDFVSNARNQVASSAGERGFCPPPGNSGWTPGLTEGHWCVQVTVEDGGPNDADGLANSAIVDPGGVAVPANGNTLPVAVADTLTTPINQVAVVNVLANDSDVDGDALIITQAVGSFGSLQIQADQQLVYTPKADFFGTDVVVYSISDGKGGTTSAELTVTVLNNNAPVLSNDTAATDDRTTLRINVLANDTDPDGNPLTLISATAQQGTVTVQQQQLTYVPKAGFDGVDTIRYLVQDDFGAQAEAEVKVTVKAYQEVMVVNQSRGGSLSPWWLASLAAAALLLRRRRSKALLAGALLLLSPLGHSADWYLQGSYGQSKADSAAAEFQSQLPAGNILSFDGKDQFKALQLGYQWYPAVAVELGYLDSGEGQLTLKGDSLTPEQYHQQVKAYSPILADGVTLGLRLTPWQNGNWRLEVPFGLIRWDSEISSQRGATELQTKLDGQELYFALDVHYQFNTNLSAGLGYQKLKLEPNDVANTYLQLRYRF